MNKAGQTALAIAEFWHHPAVSHLINQHKQQGGSADDNNVINFFGLSILDRFSHKRTDEEWLKQKLMDQTTTFVLFSQGSPYVTWSDSSSCRVCRFRYNQLQFLLEKPKEDRPTLIFLGVGKIPLLESKPSPLDSTSPATSDLDNPAWFAVDVADVPEDTIKEIAPSTELLSPKNYLALMSLADIEAGIIGLARALFSWHDRYKFCPTCGSSMRIEEAGYKHVCENKGKVKVVDLSQVHFLFCIYQSSHKSTNSLYSRHRPLAYIMTSSQVQTAPPLRKEDL